MAVYVDLKGIDGVLNILRRLPPELVAKNGGPVVLALKAGARKIYKPAQSRLEQVTDTERSTGLLEKSLVVRRGKAPKSGRGERVIIRVRKKVYPRKSIKDVTTLKTAHLLEYGSNKQTAEPWLRPAFNAHARDAIDTATASLVTQLNTLVARLGKV